MKAGAGVSNASAREGKAQQILTPLLGNSKSRQLLLSAHRVPIWAAAGRDRISILCTFHSVEHNAYRVDDPPTVISMDNHISLVLQVSSPSRSAISVSCSHLVDIIIPVL